MLVILAHPDDESFGMGATLAKYAAEGTEVHLVCATGGENGTVEPELLVGYESIAELRQAELRCAARKLGLAGVIMAGYRDSGMEGSDSNAHPDSLTAQPVERVAERFAGFIRQVRPQVVITHDPIGNYKHPDHIACNRATLRAFELAGDPALLPETEHPAWKPQKLYYQTLSKRMFKAMVKVSALLGRDPRRFGRNSDIDILSLIEEGDFPIHARIDSRRYLAVRNEAAACHASQLASGPPNRGVLAIAMRLAMRSDGYMRAIPAADDNVRESDFFEGVDLTG